MRFAVCSILALALSLPVQAQWPYRPRPEEKVDTERSLAVRQEGVATPDDAVGTEAVTCSISFSPAVIMNGQASHYTISYGGTGCVNGRISEQVTLHWNATVPDYGELTEKDKRIFIPSGCLAASGDVVAAPSGLGINGPTTVQVEVRDWTGSVLICTATGTLTVI